MEPVPIKCWLERLQFCLELLMGDVVDWAIDNFDFKPVLVQHGCHVS